MANIEDYGRHIPGAAKHRRQEDWRDRADNEGQTLAEIFPEPDWDDMLARGVPARNLGLIRSIRDAIGTKPQKDVRLRAWFRDVREASVVAHILSNPVLPTLTDANVQDMGLSRFLPKADVYAVLGHDRSLRKLDVIRNNDVFLAIEARRIRATAGTIEELATAIDDYIDRTAGQMKVSWYTRTLQRGRREGPVMILAKLSGGIRIDIEEAPDADEARRRVHQEGDRLRAILERIRTIPSERAERNADRDGPARRQVDATAEMLSRAFGLDGVQFGNSLSDAERQNEMNQAHDALADLSFLLGGKLGIMADGPKPGLAFGARGQGGVNSSKAHYEPDLHVINLTRRAGAGSLAHEWYHAMDNGSGPFRQLEAAIAGTGIAARSRLLDQTRSAPYWSQPREMTARSFEAWVRHRLESEGIRNDYLANLLDPEDWAAGDVMGRARYPYPLPEEMPAIDRAFSRMFQVEPQAGQHHDAPRPDPAADRPPTPMPFPTVDARPQDTGRIPAPPPPGPRAGPSWMDEIDFDLSM